MSATSTARASSQAIVTLEEHFISEAAMSHFGPNTPYMFNSLPTRPQLVSLGADRIAAMDAHGIKTQVISHTPGLSSAPVTICRAANDQASAACQQYPGRFRGFATLPMSRPSEAAAELERCVKELGFVGALVDNHSNEGAYYDDMKEYGVFWAKVQELDVPVYLHPTFATNATMETGAFTSNGYSDFDAQYISGPVWNWHQEVGLHLVRLFAGGLFEKYPRVQVVLGHLGEMVPFMLDRVNKATGRLSGALGADGTAQKPTRTFKEVWRENVWVTVGGFFFEDTFALVLRNTPMERICYSVDYPFQKMQEGEEFLATVEQNKMLTPAQMEMFLRGNASRMLRLDGV